MATDKRYPLNDDFEVAFEENRGRQRALLFLRGAELSCGHTGWSPTNKATRKAAAKLAAELLEGKVQRVRLDRSERKSVEAEPPICIHLAPRHGITQMRAIVDVYNRVFGAKHWQAVLS